MSSFSWFDTGGRAGTLRIRERFLERHGGESGQEPRVTIFESAFLSCERSEQRAGSRGCVLADPRSGRPGTAGRPGGRVLPLLAVPGGQTTDTMAACKDAAYADAHRPRACSCAGR